MAIDVRTRIDGDAVALDAWEYFQTLLPTVIEGSESLLEHAVALPLVPMAVEVDGHRWVLSRSERGRVRVDRDDGRAADVEAAVRLTSQQLNDLVHDQITPVGLMTAGTLDQPVGGIGTFLDWWLVLRSLWDDVAIYTPGSIELPADLTRSFELDDDPDEIRGFLEAAGFVHLRGVFDPGEMQRISDDMDASAGSYDPGDGRSWWATLDDGSERLVRMQYFADRSAAGAGLLADPRLARIPEIVGCGHTAEWASGNQLEALFKPIGVRRGISDVPWHKDCSLGRHSYDCCRLTVGVSVTGAGPTSGQLRVVAGSHRALVWPSLLDTGALDLPDVPLATEVGDLTVHLSCTLHTAQAPTEIERRVLYTGFCLPARSDATEAARMRLVVEARERAPLNTSQQATRAR